MPNIEVVITLIDGQKYSAILGADSALLSELHGAMLSGDLSGAAPSARLLQFPIDGGRSAFTFVSTSLVSIMTTPPVLIQPQPGIQNELRPAGRNQFQADASNALPSFVQIDDFLTPGENQEVLAYATDSEAEYDSSKITQGDGNEQADEKRKSKVLFSIEKSKWKEVLLGRLKLHLPHIYMSLGIRSLEIDDCEIQLTASNDGDLFVVHADSNKNNTKFETRIITFVYYLHQTPKPFEGGNLLIYENDLDGNPDGLNQVTSIAPKNNSMVVFASSRWHEVDIVNCKSGKFSDSRFTINGWLRRSVE